jgi:hypothetical protein
VCGYLRIPSFILFEGKGTQSVISCTSSVNLSLFLLGLMATDEEVEERVPDGLAADFYDEGL